MFCTLLVTIFFVSNINGKQLKCYDCTAYNERIDDCQTANSEITACDHTCVQFSTTISLGMGPDYHIYARGCGPKNGCQCLEPGFPPDSRNYSCKACTKNLCNADMFEITAKDENEYDHESNKEIAVNQTPCAHFMVN